MQLPPARVLLALAVTALAVVVLGVRACAPSDDGADAGTPAVSEEPGATSSSTSVAPSTQPTQPAQVTSSSVESLPDWYPKQASRYSDRDPVVTVSTLPPTSTTEPDESRTPTAPAHKL